MKEVGAIIALTGTAVGRLEFCLLVTRPEGGGVQLVRHARVATGGKHQKVSLVDAFAKRVDSLLRMARAIKSGYLWCNLAQQHLLARLPRRPARSHGGGRERRGRRMNSAALL